MKKLMLLGFLLSPFLAWSQVLAPAADGHILRNETYQFDTTTGQPTGKTGLTYFVYFQDLYVGGENSFTADFDPTDGVATHYNRELRGIVEFDLSSLNLSPGTFSAFLELTTDSNFYPVSPYTLSVHAWDMADSQEDGLITQQDYSATTQELSSEMVDGDPNNLGIRYSWNVTQGVNDDLADPESYSGFILVGDPLNGNEIGFISSYEAGQGAGEGPVLRFESTQPDIQVTVPACADTLAGETRVLTIIVKNVGQDDLIISQVTELSDPSHVFELNTTGMDTTLAPDDSTTFTITLFSNQPGTYSATYQIDSNDPDTPSYTFQVSCQVNSAATPDITVSVGACEDTPTGSSSTIDVTIGNEGQRELYIIKVVELEDLSDSFTLDLSSLVSPIPPKETTTFSIIFSPLTPGLKEATYRIQSDDPDESPWDFTLSCHALQQGGDIEAEPTVLYFNGAIIGQPTTKTILIKNVGTGDLKIDSLEYEGDPVFSLSTSDFKTTLHPGEQTAFMVTFQSDETWYYEGRAIIHSNDLDEPDLTIPVYGLTTTDGITNASIPGTGIYDQIITASAVAQGAYGSFFQTDLAIHNPNDTDLFLSAYYLPAGKDNTTTVKASLTLSPHATLTIPNALVFLFDQDPSGGSFGGILFTGDKAFHLLSRTYNQTTDRGTFGLTIPGVSRNAVLSQAEEGIIPGVGYSSERRTNVGFLNPGNAEVTVQIDIFSADGTSVGTATRTVPPYSLVQVSLFDLGVTNLAEGYVKLRYLQGSGFAYATILDNPTSDSIYVPLP